MIIRIRNGRKPTYYYRRLLFSDDFKLIKRAYGKSYFELHVPDQAADKWKEKYESLGLRVELIPDEYIRDNKYRNNYFRFYPADAYRCVYCGRIFPKEMITIDHVFPVKKANTKAGRKYIEKNGLSGINDIKNLVPCCKRCNSRKRTKTGLWIIRAKAGKADVFWDIMIPIKKGIIVSVVLLMFFICYNLYLNLII